jgi:hypothetical protein
MNEEKKEATYPITESALFEIRRLAESILKPKVTYSSDYLSMAEEAFAFAQSSARAILSKLPKEFNTALS